MRSSRRPRRSGPCSARPRGRASVREGLDDWFEVFRTLQAGEIWATLGAWVSETKPKFGPGVKERFEFAATDHARADRGRDRDAARAITAHVETLLGD